LLSLLVPEQFLPLYRSMYHISVESRAWLSACQIVIAVSCLLLPTTLMGATLPIICAYLARKEGALGPLLGKLYGINTLGAVVGVLAGGFILIGEVTSMTGPRKCLGCTWQIRSS
jgi:hypothetical protein